MESACDFDRVDVILNHAKWNEKGLDNDLIYKRSKLINSSGFCRLSYHAPVGSRLAEVPKCRKAVMHC